MRSFAELEEVRPVWESWHGNRDSDMDFYLTVARASRETLRPHVLVIYRDRQPDAILVGRVDRRQINFGSRYLSVKAKATVLFFVNGTLRGNASEENSRLFLEEIMRSLSRGEADAAYFHNLTTDCPLYSMAVTVPGIVFRDHIRGTRPHFSRTLPPSQEEFQSTLPPKLRKNQRYYKKRLITDFGGALCVRCFQDPAQVDRLVQDAEHVAGKSYQRGLGVGFADTPEERERVILKAQKGWLRGYVLYIAERPAAFWIGDINSGTFGSEYLGHDPEYRQYSPGMYLIVKVIEDLCGTAAEVDFGPGAADYKEALSNREWSEGSVYVFAPSLNGVRLSLTRLFVSGFHLGAQHLLHQSGFLPRIKKAWRTRVTPTAL